MKIQKKTEEIVETIDMPDVTGLTVEDAKKVLKEMELVINTDLDSTSVVTDQLPKAGIQITKGTKVILHCN